MNQLETEKKECEKTDYEANIENPKMVADLLTKEVKESIKETEVEMGKRGDTLEETVTDQWLAQMISNKTII